jgi:ankyrin repeat protein
MNIVFNCLIGAMLAFNLTAMEKEDDSASSSNDLNQELFNAVEKNDIKKISSLIKTGADINCQNEDGDTPLHIAAICNNQKTIIHITSNYFPDLKIMNNNDESVQDALNAMQYDNALNKNIKRYQKKICDNFIFNAALSDKYTKKISNIINIYKELKSPSWPIEESFYYIKSYNWKDPSIKPLIKVLLKNGARPDLNIEKDKDYAESPLHIAANHGLANLLESLVSYAKIVDPLNSKKNTPLHIAIKQEHKECVDILLKKGASVNAVDENGRTPLHDAAWLNKRRDKILKLLLEYQADPLIKDQNGQTVRDLIENYVDEELPFGFIGKIISSYFNQTAIYALEIAEKNAKKRQEPSESKS